MNPSFYVAYPSNENVRNLINAIRIIVEENPRTQVHITVRGPYIRKLSEKKIIELSSFIKGERIEIVDVDNFFHSSQNTVFFKCKDNLNLKKVWRKTSYKEYNPHITIYDGIDNTFAHEVFNILKQNFKPFAYQIEELSWLEPKNKEKLEIFHLKAIIDFQIVSNILECEFNLNTVKNLNKMDRLKYISILSRKLYEIG